MFGENGIYGQSITKIDNKKRMSIPKFTYVEPKDQLFIVDNQVYLSLYQKNDYIKIIDKLQKEYTESWDLNNKRDIDLKLLYLYKSIIKEVEADAQTRIMLGKFFDANEQILCIGAKDHLILDKQIKK